MNHLHQRLSTLCIFRPLLSDPVLSALCAYLQQPDPGLYAQFVSRLYEANGGDITSHIKDLCENSANVYVTLAGRGSEPAPHLAQCLSQELSTLQAVADLNRQTLSAPLQWDGFLPDFTGYPLDLKTHYLHRVQNIAKYGYGIYAKHRMFCLDAQGDIVPVQNPDAIRLSQLVDYKRQQQIVLDNTRALLAGRPAANILLTGDAGTGKSSTVKAVANEVWQEGLRIIEVRKDQLQAIPRLLDTLSGNPLKFVLFIDDLSFLKDDDNFNALKAVLEGSVTARSSNVVIYATSNRRHIIKETFSDRAGDEVHRNDTLQELISLSERFGLHVRFSKPDKQTYLRIVTHLAQANGLSLPQADLEAGAERFALERGGRSARLAQQFIDSLLSSNT